MGSNKENGIKNKNQQDQKEKMLNYSYLGTQTYQKPKTKKNKTQSAYSGCADESQKKNKKVKKQEAKAEEKQQVAPDSKVTEGQVEKSERKENNTKQEAAVPQKNIKKEEQSQKQEEHRDEKEAVQTESKEDETYAPSEMLVKSNQDVHEAKEQMQNTLKNLEKAQSGFTGNLSRPRGIGNEITEDEAEQIKEAAENNPDKKVIKGHRATLIIEYDKTPKEPKKKEIKELILQSVEYNFTYSSAKKMCKIGKARSEDIHLTSRFISRHHATIQEENGEYYLTDNNSTNGTILNGVSLKPEVPTALNVGDSIQFADMKFIFGISTRSE